MKPFELIGLPYRLGAIPEIHRAGDCYSISAHVIRYLRIEVPRPTRSWYRRLRNGDYQVFPEVLEAWGTKIDAPRLGSVALCSADNERYGLAVYYENGWLSYVGSVVRWSPLDVLPVVACYYPQRRNCATQLG